MGIHAPGQVLGYGLQFPRALYHLLRCNPDDKVAIEFVGDVATISNGTSSISEEDKSSQVGNPLTDLSTDLWKTFFNWVNMINDNQIDVNKTKFVLYTNKKGRAGLVNTFDKARSTDEITKVISKAKAKLSKIKNTHEVWPYYDFLFNKNSTTLSNIIANFELQICEGGGSELVKKEIRKKHIHENQIDFIHQNLAGWLQTTVLERLALKNDAIISWEEFDKQFQVLFERSRTRELIDFALTYPPEATEIKKHIKDRPIYIKQLDEIKATDQEVQEAVTEYLKAKVNRENWIQKELIDEHSALDFESKLTDFWQNTKNRIDIIHTDLDDCKRGKLLYAECRSRQETIKNQSPPSATIAGTYHYLANTPELGWHPEWENSFKKK